MMLIGIKQHLRNIWSSIHEKVKQQCGWVKKSVAYKKKGVGFILWFFNHNFHLYKKLRGVQCRLIKT